MALHFDKSSILQSLGGQTIVIIDPNVNHRHTIRQYLIALGLKDIIMLADADQSLDEQIQGQVGLIISEWRLKDKNGLQLCRSLRAKDKFRHIPFLLVSSENLRSDIILASEVGVDSYLLKPFSYEDFKSQILRLANYKANGSEIHLYLDVADENSKSGQWDAARDLYQKVLTIDEKSARAWCGLGSVFKLEKSDGEALKCYAKAIEANPYYIRALKETLEIYERQANDHGMLHILKKLHQESPDNPSYTLQLALTFLRQNFLTESEDFFRKTIRLSPKMAQAHRGLGDLFMHQEDYEMAMKQYYKALDLDGSDIKTLNAIGLTLVRLEKYDEGIAKYLAAIEIEKEHPGLHFNLGFAYEKKGDHKSAIEHYNRALIANPGFEKARRRITQISKQAS